MELQFSSYDETNLSSGIFHWQIKNYENFQPNSNCLEIVQIKKKEKWVKEKGEVVMASSLKSY